MTNGQTCACDLKDAFAQGTILVRVKLVMTNDCVLSRCALS